MNDIKTAAIVLGLIALPLLASVPEEEVLVLTEPGAVELPVGETEVTLEQIQASQALMDCFRAIQVQTISKAMPDFDPADTARVAPDGSIARLPDFTNLFTLRLPSGFDRDSAVALLEQLMEVIYAEKNQVTYDREITPNDDRFSEQWNLRNTRQGGGTEDADIDADDAWVSSRGSSSIRLGIVDTGVDATHVDLSGKVFGDQGTVYPHGTHVAGIAAAKTNNDEIGVAGVDWNAQIWTEIKGNVAVTAQAIIDAVDNGSKAINCSWGLPEYSPTVYNAFVYAYQMGVLPVVALAYEGIPEYPDIFGLWNLMVNASNRWDEHPGGDYTHKRYTDIAAPGIEILSTYPGDQYQLVSGTSMAAPHATGTAGLLLAANPTLKHYDLEWIMKLSAEDKGSSGWDEYFGYGRLNALQAVRLARPPYQISRGSPALTYVQRTNRVFPYKPRPDVNAGTYVCDIYKLEASAYHPYVDPLGWFSLTGYSLANPNPCREYLLREVNGNSITLRTYFYWLVSDEMGHAVNKWAPVDINLIPLQYTIVGRRAFQGTSGIEDQEPQPWENIVDYSAGVKDWLAMVTGEDDGVSPHSGSKMFKVTGVDDNSSDPRNDYIAFKLFDCDIPITTQTYLSFWIYVKDAPVPNAGRIVVEGHTASGHTLRDWDTYGLIIDQYSDRIHPCTRNTPQGSWVRYLFNLSPAAGEHLTKLIVIYDDGDPEEEGLFTAYIDDIKITDGIQDDFRDAWYPEVLGIGGNSPGDPDFSLLFDTTDEWGSRCYGGAQIKVDGGGYQPEDPFWLDPAPSIRKRFSGFPGVHDNSYLSWRQYDKAHALNLALWVKSANQNTHWLTYAKNAPGHWWRQGWVDMGDPTERYNQWMYFSRNIQSDFLNEYPGVTPELIYDVRIGHFCLSSWEGDHGGIVSNLRVRRREGCPFVYVVDSTGQYVEDNNILRPTENLERDYLKLRHEPVDSDVQGLLRFEIREFENEVSWIDHVGLASYVSDSPEHRIDFLADGTPVVHAGGIPPVSAIMDSIDVTSLISNEDDGLYVEGDSGDCLVATFYFDPAVIDPDDIRVVSEPKAPWSLAFECSPDGQTWVDFDTLHPREHWLSQVSMLPPGSTGPDVVHIRITWLAYHRMDCLRISESSDMVPVGTEHLLAQACHSRLGDVLTELTTEDDAVVELVPGDTLSLAFSNLSGVIVPAVRVFRFACTGRYELNGGGFGGIQSLEGYENVQFADLVVRPNPFSRTTKVSYVVGRMCRLTAKVYDATGRVVSVLADGIVTPGRYSFDWHPPEQSGEVAQGVYFLRLGSDDGTTESEKLVQVR